MEEYDFGIEPVPHSQNTATVVITAKPQVIKQKQSSIETEMVTTKNEKMFLMIYTCAFAIYRPYESLFLLGTMMMGIVFIESMKGGYINGCYRAMSCRAGLAFQAANSLVKGKAFRPTNG